MSAPPSSEQEGSTPPFSRPVALITASSAGLGAACALALAPTHSVVITYFSRPEKADEVLTKCNAINHHSDPLSASPNTVLQVDASSRPSLLTLVENVIKAYGRLDTVISNAGWTKITDFANLESPGAMDEEVWDRCWQTNVKGHLWLFHAARPWLEKAASEDGGTGSGGSFVTVSSAAGVRPGGSSLAYSVSKAALIHLTKGLATIAGPSGVRVNCVSPGLLMTEWGQQFAPEKIEAVIQRSALKRVATVEDVAEQVKVLCLNRGITGQNIIVDGGMTI